MTNSCKEGSLRVVNDVLEYEDSGAFPLKQDSLFGALKDAVGSFIHGIEADMGLTYSNIKINLF